MRKEGERSHERNLQHQLLRWQNVQIASRNLEENVGKKCLIEIVVSADFASEWTRTEDSGQGQ